MTGGWPCQGTDDLRRESGKTRVPSGAALELRKGGALVEDRLRTAEEVGDRDVRRVDAQVAVDGREKVSRAAAPLDDVLSSFVGGADHAAGLDAAARPELRERAWPVVAARL